jgi:SAM-dependent methyltransferase
MATVPFSPAELHCAWHDVECGDYRADLELWHGLATQAGGPVLEVGAGTGRVALELARAGHEVCALDLDPVLLGELSRRAAAEGLDVPVVVGDAAWLRMEGALALILVPMQTLQLLGDRTGFFAGARAALAAGGLLAAAIATSLDPFSPASADLPDPDAGERDGWQLVSQPVAIVDAGDHARIERRRHLVAPDGSATQPERHVVSLAYVDADSLAREGRAAGLEPLPPREIPATREHVGSEVVLLRG